MPITAALCYNLAMNYVRLKSYAKINLSLDVRGAEGGYHMIDSVVTTVDIYDLIAVKKRKDGLVSATMHGMGSESILPEDNNAVKAAEAFIRRYGGRGADITVWKNIPMGAGLGGSSADVAGVLRAMAALYEVDDVQGVKQLADSLGSDCGYMLTGGYARMRGRGEIVQPIGSALKLDIGILLPKGGVSTAECYELFDRVGQLSRSSDGAEAALLSGDVRALGKALHNGLYAPAKALNADVEGAYEALRAFDPLGVCMSGSGSAVYAIFENDQFMRYAMSRYSGPCRFIPARSLLPAAKEREWQKRD